MIDFDIYDHALQDDPYPTYARLRAEAPLFHQREHDYWVLSRHADVWAATRDDETFSNKMGVSIDPSAWNEHAHVVMSFLAMDPPEQVRLRRLVSKGFTPKRTRDLAPRVQRLADHYLDAALAQGREFDWIADVAGRLPMDVISEMMGVPEADRDEVRRLADLVVHREDGLRDVPQAGMDAALVLFDYYREFVSRKKLHPGDDLTTALIHAEDEGKRMTDAEINAFLFLMVVAGNETTTKLLGNAVVHLAAHPEQRAQVLADASLVPAWIEETLRFDTSSQFIGRHLLRDYTVGDVTAPAGAKLLFALGAANHDEAVFTDPERFDLHRDPEELARILSFGGGRHFCIGAHLARMETRIVLDALVARVSDFAVDRERCVRFYSANVRGFAHVPMTVRLREGA
jgi:cytochrome P450